MVIDASNNVYVIESSTGWIHKFNADGNFISKWKPKDNETCDRFSSGIAIGPQGHIFALIENWHTNTEKIGKYDTAGNLMRDWGQNGMISDNSFMQLRDIAVDNKGNIYVTDADVENEKVHKFDAGGNFITSWGSYGSGDGQFLGLSKIAVSSSGMVFIIDIGTLHTFDTNGKFIEKIWSVGGVPIDILVDDATQSFFIAGKTGEDCYITKYDDYDYNSPSLSFGSKGSGDGQFDFTYSWEGSLGLDSSGNIYVSDLVNARIQKFDAQGNFIKKWGLTTEPFDSSCTPETDPYSDPTGCAVENMYGPGSAKVELLRQFRDSVLAKIPGSRVLIQTYYKNNEQLKSIIKNHPAIKTLLKNIIDGCLPVLEETLDVKGD